MFLSRRRLRFPLVLLLFAITACGGGGDDGSGPPPLPTTGTPAAGILGDGRLPELLEWARNTQRVPAMGAIVIHRGQVVERAAVGLRSAEGGPTVTTTDQWHMGSITKSMTSTLAAILVEDGLIAWNTTPAEVWPQAAIHADFRNVTLRQFLSHTSGMKRDDDWSGASDNASGTVLEKRRAWALRLIERAPELPAGQWQYSNVGYVVAGAMLETRGGAQWETLLTNRVFAPLGMTHSGFGAPGTRGLLDQPLGHVSTSSGFDPVPLGPGSDNWQAMGPAGTVHTTLDDFALYLQAHLSGARGVPGLLTTQSFTTLHSEVAAGYALGWVVQTQLAPLPAAGLWHSGSNLRWFANAWFSPAREAAVLVVLNGGGERAARQRRRSTCSCASGSPRLPWSDCDVGQAEEERRALVLRAVHPDLAAVALDDPPHDGQPHAGAFELIRAVQALEDAKQLVHVLHVEADAVVLDEAHQRRAIHAIADLDARLLALARELDGVGDQVDEHLLHEAEVHLPGGKVGDHEFDVAAGAFRRHVHR